MCGYRHGILQASHNSISPPCETPRHLNSNVFVAHMTNPLLTERALNVLPLFDQIQPSHVEAALDEVLAANRSQLARIVGAEGAPDWQSLVEPLDEMNERLSRVWGPVSHLFSVNSTAEWRAAYNAGLPKVTDYGLELSQSEALFKKFEALSQSAGFAALSAVQQKVVLDELRDFRLSGIGLPPAKKERYRQISLRLSELNTRFEENVMDAIQTWSLHITDEARLNGMSPAAIELAAARAADKKLEGYLLTLDYPSFDAVNTFADDRELRREIYTAFATRASDQGPQAGTFDNSELMEEILKLRHEKAVLLGFANYAELSVETKMAQAPDEVEKFLLDLAARARPAAQQDLKELEAFARQQGGPQKLESWDVAYYSEKLKESSLGLNEDALRPYFAMPNVLGGLFALVEQLYGVAIVRREDQRAWHPSVEVYEVQGAGGESRGMFYLDAYARENKRSGAWMDECHGRRTTAQGRQIPVAYLVCNFRPPMDGQPGLLTHDEVLTLYHECGHGLHLLMTQVDEAAVSGINGVEWDAVELPSQFMENWCFEPSQLKTWARHWQTGEALPDDQIKRLQASRRFQAGLATVRQVEFALFDLRLHRDYQPEQGARVLGLIEQVRDEVAVLRPPAFNRMPWSFSHIFAGGYAAGYYSYKWAEVLSADAYEAFVEAGLDQTALRSTGTRFLESLLSRGGSKPAAELFEAFRGRKPKVDALLRQDGLIAEAA